MRKIGSRKAVPWLVVAAAVLTAAAAALAVGVAFARARAVRNQNITFSYYDSSGGVAVLAAEYGTDGKPTGKPASGGSGFLKPDGWRSESVDGATGIASFENSFILANGEREDSPASFDEDVSVEIFLTAGAVDSEKTEVTLECGGSSYKGVPTKPGEQSALYKKYGDGSVYRFTGPDGEPLTRRLRGGAFDSVLMTLRISCPADYPSAIVITASGVPAAD